MERKHKITIPEPCHQDWDKMTPNENGRFCLSCSKTVIDFTSMLPEEIQHYFIQNQNEKICGRFKKSQLDSITIQIPDRVLYSQTHYHKMFLLALFIAMGTTLFSCADNEGNKVNIDKIEVVTDNSLKDSDKPNNKDSLSEKPPLAPHLSANIEPIMAVSEGHIAVEPYYDTLTGTPVVENFEALPAYPGGFERFNTFIQNEFKIPKKARRITGEIEVSFVVNKEGYLDQFKVFDNIGHETGEEIIRVLKKSKTKWMPKIINGRPVLDTIRMNIIVQKDSLNIERKNRKLSKIVSIDLVKKNEKLVYNESQPSCEKTTAQESIAEGDIYVSGAAIVTNADFPNGINAFYDFFAQEFKMPEEVENAKDPIFVSFVVEKDGSLGNFQFPKNIDSQLESEITRVLNLCPKWIPGEQNGKKTREKISFPIALEKWK
ncbi:energy transducer TonB [Flavobacterium sp. HJSW_4]|uniref:energy transducer TonB n=1 Tax=Flavobacterium sp. HJSW_4 TaxID=3344660 RepID=UPI0035F4F39E